MADSKSIEFEHEGVKYKYRYGDGSLSHNNMKPAEGELPEIYAALNDELKDRDINLSTKDAFDQACISKGQKNKARSNTLIAMVLSRDPHNGPAFAMHLANLRSKPKKAVEAFENYIAAGGQPNQAICTSVGAAYLDLGDIQLARKNADRAHAMSGGRSSFTMRLYQAIKKEEGRRARRG